MHLRWFDRFLKGHEDFPIHLLGSDEDESARLSAADETIAGLLAEDTILAIPHSRHRGRRLPAAR